MCLLRKMCRKGIEMDKITIMVVDDSPFASKQIQDVVEENGYEVVAYAANGEDGIKLYDEMASGYCYHGYYYAWLGWIRNGADFDEETSGCKDHDVKFVV